VILAAVLATGLLGCNSFRDLFSAHADVAAEAASQQLPAQRLAQILSAGGKGVRINHETADYVANVWVDYTLFGQAVVHGKLPLDSASVAEAVWPEISELKGTHWHDTLMAHRASVSDAAVDSLYGASDTRVLQHILFSARPNIDSAERKVVRTKAEATLAQIRKGANFDQLAAERSEDPGSKADSGYLPPSPKGRFVPAFDSAGWSLQPGQVSGLVQTPFGYHIIKRPTMAEAHGHLVDFLQDKAGRHLDSLYMDSLASANKIEVVSGAPAAMRAAAEATDESRNSTKALVKYSGGELTVKDFLRWVRALPPQYSQQLREANDSTLNRFARILTQNVLLLREADRNKITITPLEWASVKRSYEEQIDTLRNEMGLRDGDITDSSVAIGEREKVAGLKVERYFDDLIAGKTRLRPLPSALATLLRERMPYDVHEAGVNRSVELATELKAKADSAAPKGPMQRAPGGPPVPGMEPAPGSAPTQGAPPAPSAKPAPTAGSPAPAPGASGATHP
ncbi:MAG TPA: peptidylprolyl isomerase, partial [Gemmatimonadales bacterium]|nr:peptidylprolyl isomerase [Gemmatimonadales bacterium]